MRDIMKIMRIFLLSVLLLGGAFLFIPDVSQAALVPCDGPDCQACHVVQLANNIVQFMIAVLASLTAIVVAVAGFKMVTSGGDAGAISEARGMITNVVVGFIILMSAWLVVDTLMKMFVKDDFSGFGPWNEIQCVDQPEVSVPNADDDDVPDGTVVPGNCTGQCLAIPNGINIKQGACGGTGPCTVSSEIASQLSALDSSLDSAGVNWRVTEAYPPTRVHQNACHQNGTCIDANCVGGCSADQVKTFINSASNAGLRAVYEVSTQAQKDALVQSGVSASNVQVLGSWISGAHFSVYKGS